MSDPNTEYLAKMSTSLSHLEEMVSTLINMDRAVQAIAPVQGATTLGDLMRVPDKSRD